MKGAIPNVPRVLAVDPSIGGVGFAVMEGPEELIDWGLKTVKGNKNAECLKKVAQLSDRYAPDVIVAEDCRHKGSRRSLRVRELLKSIQAFASKSKIRVQTVPRAAVRKALSRNANSPLTNYEIAHEIAKRFPELAPRLPRFRKPWMSEDERMCIFDAVGLGVTLLALIESQKGTASRTVGKRAKIPKRYSAG